MPIDYEQVYRGQRHALGEPTRAFVDFFAGYDKQHTDVLDVGCGQGRNALFIARLGHHVVGVDLSATGIAHLLEDASDEGLNIDGVVADLHDYVPTGDFDVVVIDRTLHILDAETRLTVLARVCTATRDSGYVLIADEKRNLPAFREWFMADDSQWTVVKDTRGFLFMRKDRKASP